MVIDPSAVVQFLVSLFLFPTLFQDAFLEFAWGAGDEFWIMVAKRLILLLPTLAVIAGCWVSVPSLVSLVFRQKRRGFITAFLLTWWDLGRAIVSFWGGILKFCLNLVWAVLGFLKIAVYSVWSVVQEVIFLPFRVMRSAGQTLVTSRVPWIAVVLTVFWCLIEALIFTYVMSPLVVDTLSNITGEQLSVMFLRFPLFVFLFFVVLGSYAVLSTFVNAMKSRKISTIAGIGAIEVVVLFVEVVFLYREFVDSLVPWFAQYSEGFELGVFWTLAIACFAWFGIRSISWFLFASHGTPTILSVIQGKGLGVYASETAPSSTSFDFSSAFLEKLKNEAEWVKTKGDDLLAAFMLPPLQVVAATVNFLALLINGKHMFQLPFTSLDSIVGATSVLDELVPKNSKRPARAEAAQEA